VKTTGPGFAAGESTAEPVMRVHHLNCISTCPAGGSLMDGRTDCILCRGRLTCHCILVESNDGLVLVDTGLGTGDVANPRSRLSWFFLALLSPDFRQEMTALHQIRRLGFDPSDVRHILLTHLDFDHAGGLDDFPDATVHLLSAEREHAVAQRTWLDRQRFRPQQWSTAARWKTYSATAGDSWFGFDCVRPLAIAGLDLALVPLLGHTLGHAGVAVRGERSWLLQAGDAYFHHDEIDLHRPSCTPGLRFYQWMMEKDRDARLGNQERLRELRRSHGHEVEIFCGHDLGEFESLAGRPATIPAADRGRAAAGS
jgi:glyoxylase-like metal-dependent hydrolase (beta-lactamase superfamily II)